MTWSQFERAVKFLGGMSWATWELIIRDDPNFARLTFIASILGLSELVHAISAATGPSRPQEREEQPH